MTTTPTKTKRRMVNARLTDEQVRLILTEKHRTASYFSDFCSANTVRRIRMGAIYTDVAPELPRGLENFRKGRPICSECVHHQLRSMADRSKHVRTVVTCSLGMPECRSTGGLCATECAYFTPEQQQLQEAA